MGRWLRGLPGAPKPKLVLIGLGVLAVLVLLSPVTSAIAALAFIVCVVVLAVRAFQRRAVMGWGIAAASSLVLALALAGLAGALYSEGTGENNRVASGAGGDGDSGNAADQYQPTLGEVATPCDAVAPELEELAERWSSFESGFALYLPSRIPFAVESVEDWDSADGLYEINGEGTKVSLEFLDPAPAASDSPPELADVQTVVMEQGDAHPYLVWDKAPQIGYYSVYFGPVEEDGPVMLSYRLESLQGDFTYAEFYRMLSSMVEIEPTDGTSC